MKTELCEIMTEFGSDKGRGHHNYTLFYHKLFNRIRNKKITIFELGLGTNNIDIPSNMGLDGKPGASLRGWRKYFENSEVYGADIDKNILFEEDRIKTFYCDQNDQDIIKNMWNLPELKDLQFDIIIDDGLHECNANITFLENSIYKLKKEGFYIIEDVINYTISNFKSRLEQLCVNNFLKFDIIQLTNPNNNIDNTIIIIQNKI